MSDSRASRLNDLATVNGAQSYLEIGLHKGHTFQEVACPRKVGVDPLLLFSADPADGGVEVHEATSDTFFGTVADANDRFDLIFLDGLHTFEQTMRDFVSSLSFSTERTIWVIDDTVPVNWMSAWPSLDRVVRVRHWLRSGDGPWMGDVYKLVLAIHDLFPMFSYATTEDHGQTVVWRQRRPEFKPAFESVRELSGVGYFALQRHYRSLLRLSAWAEIMDRVEAAYSGSVVRSD